MLGIECKLIEKEVEYHVKDLISIYCFCLQEKVVLLLHGFLGTSDDWVPMMKALSPSARVIAVDLPGHGESQMLQHHVENSEQFPVTV